MRVSFFKDKDFPVDSLTKLYTRETIVKYAKYLINQKKPFSLILIDVDNFKNINDNFGHTVGDKAILEVVKKIKKGFGSNCVIGRFGGDEFLLIAEGIVEYNDIWHLCNTAFRQANGFEIDLIPNYFITCTLGLARYPVDGNSYDRIFEKADKALYRGKTKGRSCFIIYLDSKHKNIKLHTENDLTISTMQRHMEIFRMFRSPVTLKCRIEQLLYYFSVNLMVDFIALQSETKIICQRTYDLLNNSKFAYIDTKLMIQNINPEMGLSYFNNIEQLEKMHGTTLLKEFKNQDIKSNLTAEISYRDKFYGVLRAEACSTNRIWQTSDMDLLITGANMIALSLFYENKTLDELE